MREIKFRVWHKKKKKFYTQNDGAFCIVNFNCWYIETHSGRDVWVNNDNGILIQFTGLKDKNGEEGYHKDIWTDGLHKYLVEWIDKKACFVLRRSTKKYVAEYSMAHFIEGEIIGNIYENPEFLEA